MNNVTVKYLLNTNRSNLKSPGIMHYNTNTASYSWNETTANIGGSQEFILMRFCY